jgi:hypothetical protein
MVDLCERLIVGLGEAGDDTRWRDVCLVDVVTDQVVRTSSLCVRAAVRQLKNVPCAFLQCKIVEGIVEDWL